MQLAGRVTGSPGETAVTLLNLPSVTKHQQPINLAVIIFPKQPQLVLQRCQLFDLESSAVQCDSDEEKLNPEYTQRIK